MLNFRNKLLIQLQNFGRFTEVAENCDLRLFPLILDLKVNLYGLRAPGLSQIYWIWLCELFSFVITSAMNRETCQTEQPGDKRPGGSEGAGHKLQHILLCTFLCELVWPCFDTKFDFTNSFCFDLLRYMYVVRELGLMVLGWRWIQSATIMHLWQLL